MNRLYLEKTKLSLTSTCCNGRKILIELDNREFIHYKLIIYQAPTEIGEIKKNCFYFVVRRRAIRSYWHTFEHETRLKPAHQRHLESLFIVSFKIEICIIFPKTIPRNWNLKSYSVLLRSINFLPADDE